MEDLDRFDLVVALDSGVLADIRGRVAEEYPTGPDKEYYTEVSSALRRARLRV